MTAVGDGDPAQVYKVRPSLQQHEVDDALRGSRRLFAEEPVGRPGAAPAAREGARGGRGELAPAGMLAPGRMRGWAACPERRREERESGSGKRRRKKKKEGRERGSVYVCVV